MTVRYNYMLLRVWKNCSCSNVFSSTEYVPVCALRMYFFSFAHGAAQSLVSTSTLRIVIYGNNVVRETQPIPLLYVYTCNTEN